MKKYVQLLFLVSCFFSGLVIASEKTPPCALAYPPVRDMVQAIKHDNAGKACHIVEQWRKHNVFTTKINEADEATHLTPLAAAAQMGSLYLTHLFTTCHADVNRRADGFMPISWAVLGGHTHVARFLLDKGARVDDNGMFYGSPAYHAVQTGNRAALHDLIMHGALLDDICKKSSALTPRDLLNTSPLFTPEERACLCALHDALESGRQARKYDEDRVQFALRAQVTPRVSELLTSEVPPHLEDGAHSLTVYGSDVLEHFRRVTFLGASAVTALSTPTSINFTVIKSPPSWLSCLTGNQVEISHVVCTYNGPPSYTE